MDCHSNGDKAGYPPGDRLNLFALVIYIPDPLGAFLDDLRRELVPHYNPHAHVSVLPPRPLSVDGQTAAEHVRMLAEGFDPFDVELADVAIFHQTDVIYIEVGRGAAELRRMHQAMSAGLLAFDEPYEYCPHITLAQELPHERAADVFELAAARWRQYRGSRVFRAEQAAFVQSMTDQVWIDLAQFNLGPGSPVLPKLIGQRG